jgi:hypothetical protein
MESVPIKDVAALSGVSDGQLARVIRLTATASFLHEPQPGQVCHTALSASFVSNPGHLDAAMFLAESAAPAALRMAPATHRFGADHTQARQPSESAYYLDLNTVLPFHLACEEHPRLRRQWHAYLHYAAGLPAVEDGADNGPDTAIDILMQLNWAAISNCRDVPARIVEVRPFRLPILYVHLGSMKVR